MILEQDVDAFLKHHGIKGQRWGVRNEHDVSPEKQAKRDLKAKKFTAKADMFQTKINELNSEPYKNFLRAHSVKKQVKILSKERDKQLKDAEAKRQGKLSSTQKKVVIGAGVVAGILAIHQVQSGEMHSLATRGKLFLEGKKGSIWSMKPELAEWDMDASTIMDRVVKPINPDYGKFGSKMNCRRCTFAYEMRRRGYDVAATRTTSGRGQDVGGVFNALNSGNRNYVNPGKGGMLSRVFLERNKASRPFTTAVEKFGAEGMGAHKMSPESIFSELGKQPNGARGEVTMMWGGVGGLHSMAWENIKGKTVLFDTQTGKQFGSPDDIATTYKQTIKNMGFTRLDDIPLNHDFLMRWLKNA